MGGLCAIYGVTSHIERITRSYAHDIPVSYTLMIYIAPIFDLKEWNMVEFFAGKGNLSLAMRASGFRVASLDLLYPVANSESHGSNCMDILSASGFWCLVCANSPEWCFCLIFVFFLPGEPRIVGYLSLHFQPQNLKTYIQKGLWDTKGI